MLNNPTFSSSFHQVVGYSRLTAWFFFNGNFVDFTIHVINELSIVDEIISSGLSERNVSRKSRNDKREKLSYFFHVFHIG